MLSLAFLVDVIADNRYDYIERDPSFFPLPFSPKWEITMKKGKIRFGWKSESSPKDLLHTTKKYPIYIRRLLS